MRYRIDYIVINRIRIALFRAEATERSIAKISQISLLPAFLRLFMLLIVNKQSSIMLATLCLNYVSHHSDGLLL